MVNSTDIFPGDIVKVFENHILMCDIILVDGSILVNESVLTGEPNSIVKTSIDENDKLFNQKK